MNKSTSCCFSGGSSRNFSTTFSSMDMLLFHYKEFAFRDIAIFATLRQCVHCGVEQVLALEISPITRLLIRSGL
jgi:hypothetical protein